MFCPTTSWGRWFLFQHRPLEKNPLYSSLYSFSEKNLPVGNISGLCTSQTSDGAKTWGLTEEQQSSLWLSDVSQNYCDVLHLVLCNQKKIYNEKMRFYQVIWTHLLLLLDHCGSMLLTGSLHTLLDWSTPHNSWKPFFMWCIRPITCWLWARKEIWNKNKHVISHV